MTRRALLDHAPYTPFMDRRTAHPPGLSPMDPADWFPVDPDYIAQMALRARLVEKRPEIVLAQTPEASLAIVELLTEVLTYLEVHPRYHVVRDMVARPDGEGVKIEPARPLETLANLVADDLCLLLPGGDEGEYRLVAAVLCFPSRWLLSEKIGRPLTAIHDPVPDYDAVLARRVNRVFEAIRPGAPMVRVNWLVHAVAELHLPLGLSDKLVAEADPGDGLYLRTERQTLTRLPKTGAVVFGIKTSICPLEVLTPDQAVALRRELEQLDPESIAYRAGTALHGLALEQLEQMAETSV